MWGVLPAVFTAESSRDWNPAIRLPAGRGKKRSTVLQNSTHGQGAADMRRARILKPGLPHSPFESSETLSGGRTDRVWDWKAKALKPKGFVALWMVLWTAGWVWPGGVLGQVSDHRPSPSAESAQAAGRPGSAAPPVVYKPPLRGAPADRIGGGTRSLGIEEPPQVLVLAPDHTGLTIRPRPTLYWYISRPTTLRVDFTLREEQTGAVVYTRTLPAPQSAGIQRISLAEWDGELAAGKDYRWTVTVVVEPGRPSRDVFSVGMIRRVAGPSLPADTIQGDDKLLAAAWYAGEGLWYDALEAVGQAVEAAPGDRIVRTVRASLLDQAGLCPAARFEMSR